MKNQYFADKRDYFKYDLLMELMEGVSGLRQLTFVPMLTPDDGSGDGQFTSYDRGQRRADLYEFLQQCLRDGKRDIQELRRYFATKTFTYTAYRDCVFFEHGTRDDYFRSIPESALQSALVFFDQDTGLQVSERRMRQAGPERYLLYSDLAPVYGRMNGDSVALIYQHLPHEDRQTFFTRICAKLAEELASPPPGVVSDNEIAFFAVSRQGPVAERVSEVLRDYARRHQLIVFPNC